LKRLLALPGVNVTDVEFAATAVIATVALRCRRLVCPHWEYSRHSRHDSRPVDSRRQHLELGLRKLQLRRLDCPEHVVITRRHRGHQAGTDLVEHRWADHGTVVVDEQLNSA
jgi:hypothetical protein